MSKQSLAKATKKSVQENKVQQLDDLGTDIGEFIEQESLTVIENIVGEFIERVHTNINNEKGMVTTGRINDITIKAENNQVNIYANKWLIYQDRGVNGAVEKLYNTPHSYSDKMPPVDVFKEWIKDKNIRLINNEKLRGEPSPFKELTEEEQIEKVAWGMAKNVFKKGFKPRNVYSKEIPKLVEDLQKEIADFAVQSLIQSIDVKESAKRVITP